MGSVNHNDEASDYRYAPELTLIYAYSALDIHTRISASFVLRIYAIMGLSRTGLAAAVLLGLIGLSSIGLDIVRRLFFAHMSKWLIFSSGKTFNCPARRFRTRCTSFARFNLLR